MMDELEVPLALSGFQIDAHEAVAKQVVARAMTTIEVRSGIFDRQVYEAQFFVDGNLRPDARVAVHRPRIVLPGFAAEVARSGDGVEPPQHFSRARVEGADKPFGVVVGDG